MKKCCISERKEFIVYNGIFDNYPIMPEKSKKKSMSKQLYIVQLDGDEFISGLHEEDAVSKALENHNEDFGTEYKMDEVTLYKVGEKFTIKTRIEMVKIVPPKPKKAPKARRAHRKVTLEVPDEA